MEITSIRNRLLQKIRKAVTAGRPTEDGLIVAEGPHLLEEALRGTWPIAQVLTTPAGRDKYADLLQRVDAEVIEIASRAFESAADTQHSQQVLALIQPRNWTWHDLLGQVPLIIALDGIQDPGNAGTIVRSAEAFGATGVVFLKGSARVSNGKLLRASAGSMFRMPFLEGLEPRELVRFGAGDGLAVYTLHAAAPLTITTANLRGPLMLVAGNEGAGLSPLFKDAAAQLSIPTKGVESLNAAIACSLALFAAQLQREAA
jgi:RNA methyltransferase, TrmH family